MKLDKVLACFCILIGLSYLVPMAFSQATGTFSDQPEIGIFYYVWWEPNSWDHTCADTPVLNCYNSNNSTIISQHLKALEELGIDFVIVSWWGTHDGFGRFTDTSAKQVFEIANSTHTSLKFAILVEPFDIEYSVYDYDAIYNQIYYDFFLPYSSIYYYEEGNPLICFYNDPGYAPSLTDSEYMTIDARFTVKVVGEEPYTQWMYLDLVRHVVRENEVSVTPRYDESRLPDRQMGIQIDPQLDQGVYDYEWQKAIQLWEEGQVNTILISSWNEYYERTEIEPHFDATAIDEDPYFLYNKTQTYIEQIRQLKSPLPQGPNITSPADSPTYTSNSSTPGSPQLPSGTNVIPEYPSTLQLFAFIISITSIIAAYKHRNRKQRDKGQQLRLT